MCDLKPGDEVVCVGFSPSSDDPWAANRRNSGLLRVGGVYTITAVYENPRQPGDIGVCVAGLVSPFPGGGFTYRVFRKVQRRDLSAWLETAAKNTDALDKPRCVPARRRERV